MSVHQRMKRMVAGELYQASSTCLHQHLLGTASRGFDISTVKPPKLTRAYHPVMVGFAMRWITSVVTLFERKNRVLLM